MPAASDGLVRKKAGVVRALQSPQDEPDIRLSLHDELYSVCLMRSGHPAESPVTATFALRLRPVGRFSRAAWRRAPAHFGLAVRLLPRPSCTAAADRFIRDRVPRPRDQTDVPAAVSVRRDPVYASDDGQRPSTTGTIRTLH